MVEPMMARNSVTELVIRAGERRVEQVRNPAEIVGEAEPAG